MNEIEILKKNIRDLQEQLHHAYVRIKQLREELDKNKPNKGLYNPDASHIKDE
jgi:predicted RNase H-like nuclease (RuvC/YqgF family)|tara:strand:- start:387 stop:545 length:159 start_codon:yes stop_codon:yes gene_type:complete